MMTAMGPVMMTECKGAKMRSIETIFAEFETGQLTSKELRKEVDTLLEEGESDAYSDGYSEGYSEGYWLGGQDASE